MRQLLVVLLVSIFGGLPAWSQSAPSSQVYVFPLFIDGAAGAVRYRSTLKIRNLDAGTLQCTLTQRNTSSPFVGVDGGFYPADVFDGGFSPPAQTQITLDRFLPWEILRTNAQSSLRIGYASLSCPGKVETQLLFSLTDSQNNKLGETTVMPAAEGNSFQFLIDRRDGTRLGFSLANASSAAGQFVLIARDRFNYEVDRAYDTIESWSQVSKFVDEMLTVPADFTGSVELVGLTGGHNYAIGLQFTGAVFTAIPPLVRSTALPISSGGTQ
jgi:hypothetical protein